MKYMRRLEKESAPLARARAPTSPDVDDDRGAEPLALDIP